MTGDARITRVLVTGGGGQLARSLCRVVWPAGWHVFALDRRGLDISDRHQVEEVLGAAPWSLVVNAAAFTDVDGAEARSADAFRTNAEGPAWLARASRRIGAPIVQISTDYVFDGTLDRPYAEEDKVAPISAYGRSKAEGEARVRQENGHHLIIRTAWLYSAAGRNFVRRIRRAAWDRGLVRVVADQVGSPTSADVLAEAVARSAARILGDGESAPFGTYHLAGEGSASWADLARAAIACEPRPQGRPPRVVGISSEEWPSPVSRPANSRLDCRRFRATFGWSPPPWTVALCDVIDELSVLEPLAAPAAITMLQTARASVS